MGYGYRTLAGIAVVIMAAHTVQRHNERIMGLMPPAHLSNHTLIFEPGLIPEAVGAALRDAIEQQAAAGGGMPTNTRDTNFYVPKREHIGEGRPMPAGGRCDHPFLVPSKDGSLCVIPGRLDIGRWFIMTGGLDALRENYEQLVARVLSFGVYLFGESVPLPVRELFDGERFQSLARRVCPADQQHLDPFQANFIVQVPGQTVAAHLDGVYFWGADRFQFPQWLLAAMQFSNLFSDRFVHQVQVVGYLHDWAPDPRKRAGEFVFWDGSSRAGVKEQPLPLAGSAVDGTKTVHAATVYMPQAQPPAIDKDEDTRLFFAGTPGAAAAARRRRLTEQQLQEAEEEEEEEEEEAAGGVFDAAAAASAAGGGGGGGNARAGKVGEIAVDDLWQLRVGDRVLRNYSSDDLRMSLVYRARCFRDAAQADAFNAQLENGVDRATKDNNNLKSENHANDNNTTTTTTTKTEPPMELEDVLRVFAEDLAARGAVRSAADALELDAGKRLELALLIMDTYIKYPLPTKSDTAIMLNYCALPRTMPWTAPIMRLVC